jgi:hypothetical protein
VLIFRRIQLYTCNIWQCHSLWEFVVPPEDEHLRLETCRGKAVPLQAWSDPEGRLLSAEVCASALVMLDTTYSEAVWRVLATHSIRQFPLHFPPVSHRVPSYFNWTLPSYVGTSRDSTVSIATRCGLDIPGIESLWRRGLPHPSRPAHPASCTVETGCVSGG